MFPLRSEAVTETCVGGHASHTNVRNGTNLQANFYLQAMSKGQNLTWWRRMLAYSKTLYTIVEWNEWNTCQYKKDTLSRIIAKTPHQAVERHLRKHYAFAKSVEHRPLQVRNRLASEKDSALTSADCQRE